MRMLTAVTLAFGTMGALQTFAQQSTDHALRFNGISDFVATAERLPSVNTFTMEAWVRPTAPHEIDRESQSGYAGMEGQRYAVYPSHGSHLWGTGHACAGFSVGTNGISVYEHTGCYIPAVLVYEAEIRGWTHVAVVYRDRVPSLYVNGRLVRTGPRSVQPYVHPSTGDNHPGRMIGGIGGGAYGYFEGELDDVRVWGSALGDREVRAAAGGEGRFALVTFDMNRSGAGAGLKVRNVTGAASTVSTAATYGTASTPVFTERGAVAPARILATDPHCPEISTPLAPACDPVQTPVGQSPALR